MALPIFTITLFISAFVLFLVQPIVGKMILPKLGGTPQVWNTCMVFFQAVLLAGYGYTHFSSTRLSVRRQIMVHALLLLVPIIFLIPPLGPLNVRGWAPPPGGNPVFATLGLLALVVGLPFFVVATSAPLLQRWFAYTGDKAAQDPYFLYAASNLGSLMALLAYPMVVEWIMPLDSQAITWAILYGLLLVMVLVCGYRVWLTAPAIKLAPAHDSPPLSETPGVSSPAPPNTDITANPPVPAPAPAADKSTAIKKGPKHPQPKGLPPKKDLTPASIPHATEEVTPWRRFRWIMLGAIPSSMMLGVTTHITTDLSPIPLFWLVPLTLYLLSFILVFARWPVVWTGAPHDFFLLAQPIALALMVYSSIAGGGAHGLFEAPIICAVFGFFATAMVCHGELARDRPSTKYLTEFYLLMSVGGVVGGVFNGLLAPLLFTGNLEYPLAIIGACLMRPKMKESGWTDDLVSHYLDEKAAAQGKGKQAKESKADNPSFHLTIDAVLAGVILLYTLLFAFPLWTTLPSIFSFLSEDPRRTMIYLVAFGVPTIISCFYFNRPLRFGGAIAAILLVFAIFYSNQNPNLFADRSYFGFIRVRAGDELMQDYKDEYVPHEYTNLMHGNIDHGLNFKKNTRLADQMKAGLDYFDKLSDKDKTKIPERYRDRAKFPDFVRSRSDYHRLATTYYHQLGPAGRVMQKFNWFKDDVNFYSSDARMPASLVGLGATNLGTMLVGAWSEPPFATIGLGTGTMASYGRPFQHVHFYEIDNHVRKLSLPLQGKAYFNYLEDAKARGSQVQVLMGDARTRMGGELDEKGEATFKYKPYNEENERLGRHEGKPGGGPDNFYHMMVVDAFSSDAIPVHLLTRESFLLYFQKLVPDGILAVHTSNRYVNLVKVVADVANSIELPKLDKNGVPMKDGKLEPLVCVRGHDSAPGYPKGGRRGELKQGHYTSEWVLVAHNRNILNQLTEPAKYKTLVADDNAALKKTNPNMQPRTDKYWFDGSRYQEGLHVWTDDYSNLLRVLRTFDTRGGDD